MLIRVYFDGVGDLEWCRVWKAVLSTEDLGNDVDVSAVYDEPKMLVAAFDDE